ncbi:hypothetical protein ColKHC_00308 [Colletotrichum higginsianum]|nr:hypothetical protein ColKHC_00308 [Colletotrichum higginsianum]
MAKLPSSQVRRVDSDSSSISWGLDYLQEEKIAPLTWIESPVASADEDTGEIKLCVRHSANTIELFSDLFFVANLETFTQTHSITNLGSLAAYLGFFSIIWFTWFQITLHDVRFSIDSGYERMCKILQFLLFVGFALVGSSFSPGTKEHNNANFQLLCNILFATRLLLVAQYSVALHFVRKKTKALNWPLSLTISGNGLGIYYVWYIILLIEIGITLGLSSIWKSLSFKHTHLTERMGLFTLVIIGEGAIGATKTIGIIMGDTGLRLDACLIIGCTVFILMFCWMLYFDNPPECKFGTVRQQIWAALHFPFHLGMIGVVEGSQQIALAWQVLSYFSDFFRDVRKACITENQDGQVLAESITTSFKNLKMPDSAETRSMIPFIYQEIYSIGNITGVCSPANTTGGDSLFLPNAFRSMTKRVLGVLFESYLGSGATLPTVALIFLVILAIDRYTKHLSAKTLRRNMTETTESWERALAERGISEASLVVGKA